MVTFLKLQPQGTNYILNLRLPHLEGTGSVFQYGLFMLERPAEPGAKGDTYGANIQ
jgi:hypothetical protein